MHCHHFGLGSNIPGTSSITVLFSGFQNACDVNLRAKEGDTALFRMANLGLTRGIEMMVTHGADPNIQDSEGKTPLLEILQNKNVKPPTEDSPRTKQV